MTDAIALTDAENDGPVLHLVDPGPALADVMEAFARLRFENVRLMDAMGAGLGVAAVDLRALFFISGNENVTPKRVAEHLGLTTGAMTTLVDRIEKAGLARREPHPTDRRSLLVTLTELGRSAVESGGEIYAAAFSSSVPADRVAIVHETFLQLADQLGHAADEHAARVTADASATAGTAS